MKTERIARMSMDEINSALASGQDQTDWPRIRAEEAAGIEPGPDEDDFEVDWASARLVIPAAKQAVSLRLDADILAFFKAQGRGYQTRMNAVLRAYKEAQEKAPKRG